MRPLVKKALLCAGALLGVAVLIPAGYVAYLYGTYIDETLTSGSGYGFTIGQSKRQVYEAAGQELRAGRIVSINTVDDREEEIKAHPWLEDDLTVADARERFTRWDHWALWLYRPGGHPSLLALIVFDGDELSGVGQPGQLGPRWHPPNFPSLGVHQGQTRDEVFAVIEALSRSSGYNGLRLSTGWMARRQPKTFAMAELQLVEADDDWTLLVGPERSYFNTIRLRFADGKLVEIHRHRQYFEVP